MVDTIKACRCGYQYANIPHGCGFYGFGTEKCKWCEPDMPCKLCWQRMGKPMEAYAKARSEAVKERLRNPPPPPTPTTATRRSRREE